MEAEVQDRQWCPQDVEHPTCFGKWERLCGEKPIGRLFGEGKSLFHYPLRVVYTLRSSQDAAELSHRQSVCRVMVSVSKRVFKRAVKRNRVKRQVREAWRTSKGSLASDVLACGKVLDVAFVFVGKDLPTTDKIVKAMAGCVGSLRAAVEKERGDA